LFIERKIKVERKNKVEGKSRSRGNQGRRKKKVERKIDAIETSHKNTNLRHWKGAKLKANPIFSQNLHQT